MATLFNSHPYISSSGKPVGTKFTATYVGMVDGCYHYSLCDVMLLTIMNKAQVVSTLHGHRL